IARPENENLVSYGDLQFSGQDKIRFILARMRMPRHAHSRRETDFQKAVCTAGIGARQTDGADTDVEVIAIGSRLIFNWRGSLSGGWNVMHGKRSYSEARPNCGQAASRRI